MKKEEFDKLPYREQLRFLIVEAQKANDIYAMLLIQDAIKEYEKEQKALKPT